MHIQVVGAGSWGLALARRLALNGHHVRLWCREEDDPAALRTSRESAVYLPGVTLPESIEVSMDVDPDVEMAVLAVPSHVMRTICEQYGFAGDTIRVSVAKGIENDSLMRMSEVIRDTHGDCRVVALSGPSHAEEVGQDRPTTITAASGDEAARKAVQAVFMAESFRVYTSPDIIGVECGGSLKNVIAIAAGACAGLELGDNATAALITRGLAEMSRLGVAMGADPLTFAGLSGMGDLIVTCQSQHSRNRRVGERVARGESMEDVLGGPMVAEGVRTTKSVIALARRHHVEMPISEQVYAVLFAGADPREAVTRLMLRDPKAE